MTDSAATLQAILLTKLVIELVIEGIMLGITALVMRRCNTLSNIGFFMTTVIITLVVAFTNFLLKDGLTGVIFVMLAGAILLGGIIFICLPDPVPYNPSMEEDPGYWGYDRKKSEKTE